MEFPTALREFSQGQEEFYRLNWYTFFSLISLPYPAHEVSVLIFQPDIFHIAKWSTDSRTTPYLSAADQVSMPYFPTRALPAPSSPLSVLNSAPTLRTPGTPHCTERVPFVQFYTSQSQHDTLSNFPNLHNITTF